MGQAIPTSQFYLYGKKYCTKTGYQAAAKEYTDKTILDTIDLNGKIYLVTGANSGIGKEIATFLAQKGGKVFIVCRNKERGEQARDEIVEKSQNKQVSLLVGDCGLGADVRRIVEEFGAEADHLDGLVCNAGALLEKKTLTSEGIETTLACHLLFGSYLLGKLLLPMLKQGQDPRIVLVSSGGMYNTNFPDWEIASGEKGDYDGTLQYAYAKRGQVLLAERWTESPDFAGVKVMTCHPGWTATPGVDESLANQKKYLEPLRDPWEGAEGICWLCVAPSEQIEGGGFYLDRASCRKHVAGPFFSDGSRTKNSRVEVDEMMRKLEDWSADRAHDEIKQDEAKAAERAAATKKPAKKKAPLVCVPQIDLPKFMGKWYVIACIPTAFEVGAFNATEEYTLNAKGDIDVAFEYHKGGFDGPKRSVPQKAFVHNKQTNSEWRVQPVWPVKLPYLIIECDVPNYTYAVIGYPSRDYLWVLGRQPQMAKEVFDGLRHKLETTHEYNLAKMVMVPQNWGDQAPPAAAGPAAGSALDAAGAPAADAVSAVAAAVEEGKE